MKPFKHNGLVCGICMDVIASFWTHHFVSCECGNAFVDGGFDYFRYGAKDLKKVTQVYIMSLEAKKAIKKVRRRRK